MKKLIFILMAITLVNVSFAGELSNDDVDCKNTIHKNRSNEKGAEVVIVREEESKNKGQ